MRMNEHKVLSVAFEQAFPFMLNRMADAGVLKDPDPEQTAYLSEQCWNELTAMLDEMGVMLEGGQE